MIKILIADDQALFLDMLCTIISSYEGFEVTARAKNGKEAVTLFLQHRPDVSLLDLQMPLAGGIEALKLIKKHDENAKVIMLTTFSDDDNVLEACKAGADGYILKDVRPELLINAIKCVQSGLVCMNKNVMSIIGSRISEPERALASARHPDTNVSFCAKDIEVIRLIGEGLSNRQIAEKLNYSEGTIRNRISSILSDTGLSDRTQIALFAIKNRLV